VLIGMPTPPPITPLPQDSPGFSQASGCFFLSLNGITLGGVESGEEEEEEEEEGELITSETALWGFYTNSP